MTRLLAKTRFEGDCWIWQGGTTAKGYGRIMVGSRRVYVHRLGWSLVKKDRVPKYLENTCGRLRCWNPDHWA